LLAFSAACCLMFHKRPLARQGNWAQDYKEEWDESPKYFFQS